jgi:HD-GYP domain-containing protein (c-di-GMP phosphodiesterase class II)
MTSRRGRVALLCGLAPTLVVALLCLRRPALFASLEFDVYDRITRWIETAPPGGRVVIVDVDEKSLGTVGQWPWPRQVIGSLISRLRDAGAAVVALDIIFAEPDRHQDKFVSGDATLAATLKEGRVVLGYALTFDGGDKAADGRPCAQHAVGLTILHPGNQDATEPFFRASKAICNIEPVTAAASESGFLNAAPDFDGILRRVPLLLEFQGRVYPSLALAAVAASLHIEPQVLRVANVNAMSLILGDTDTRPSHETLTVPLDGKSNLLVRYRGAKQTFSYVSAVDVLKGDVARARLEDKIVFVGTTALGTREVVATPLDTLFTGVEVQATVADNLLQRDFFRRSEHSVAVETLAVLVLGSLAALSMARFGFALGSLSGAAVVAAAWGLSAFMLSRYGIVLSPLFPSIGVISAIGTMTAAGLALERRRADHADDEKRASQRLMVQTLLSLLEMRNPDTGRHSRRTERYTRVLAAALMPHARFRHYLTPERVELLSVLAPLHDIGKVGIADAILDKAGALTPQELVEIRKHPAYGREVIENAEKAADVRDDMTLSIAKDIVYTHHEKWDGTGYPQRLQGQDIPIPGRLMALVDVYDAMRSPRAYHRAQSHNEVRALILAERGKHFDPDVVDAFVQVSDVFRALSEARWFEDQRVLPASRTA